MFEVQINSMVRLTVILVGLTDGLPLVGVLPADVVLYYRKAGGTPVLKTLTSSNFSEVDGTLMPGLYEITFTTAEMDTAGEFVAVVQESISANIEQTNILFRVSTLAQDLLLEIQGAGFTTADHSLTVLKGAVDTGVTSITTGITTLTDMSTRLLGLSQENLQISDQIYDVNNNLIASTIRTYSSEADVLAATSPLEEYTLSATYDSSNRLTDYRIVRVGS